MRLAVVSDIHANIQALDAAVADAGQVDGGLCLGDLVGYGGSPSECIDRVRDLGWPSLTGNHDRACTEPEVLSWFNDDAATVVRWTLDVVGPDRLAWLASLPARGEREGVLLVHGSVRDPTYEYILDASTAGANLELAQGSPVLHGHTHIPGYFYRDGGAVAHNYWLGRIQLRGAVLVNPGSVGQPRDRNPDASYGIWDTTAGTFEWRRVAYDTAGAQEAIIAAGLPRRFADRLGSGY